MQLHPPVDHEIYFTIDAALVGSPHRFWPRPGPNVNVQIQAREFD
jgi:hypothetical protein